MMLFVEEFYYATSSDSNERQTQLLGCIAQFTKFIQVAYCFFYIFSL